jgi:hypothetical protein
MATVFTTVGKEWVVDKLDGTVTTSQNKIGWGTGAGTSSVSDTTLFTEASETRATGTFSQPQADTTRVVGTLTATGTKTITNAGVFDATTGGVMMLKADFTGIPLLTNDRIEFTFDLRVT